MCETELKTQQRVPKRGSETIRVKEAAGNSSRVMCVNVQEDAGNSSMVLKINLKEQGRTSTNVNLRLAVR